MTILCRTGCNQQVIYEENEFPDGFIYLLPVNLDGTIHNCKNLSEKIKGFINYSNLDNVLKDKSELFKANFRLVDKSDYDQYSADYFQLYSEKDKKDKKSAKKYLKKLLINLQTRCVLFPDPHSVSDFSKEDFENDEDWEQVMDLEIEHIVDMEENGFCISSPNSQLVELASCYERLDQLDCAMTALQIQEQITHDQIDNLIKLANKKNSHDIKDDENDELIENTSTVSIREKFRVFENALHEFLRRNIPIREFQEMDSELFIQLDKQRQDDNEKRRGSSGNHDDVFEKLSYGQCIRVIINQRNREKKKRKEKNEKYEKLIFIEISSDTLFCMKWIGDNFRNPHDHSLEDPEKIFDQQTLNAVTVFIELITIDLKNIEYT
jgi:hypothetical protein